MLNTFDVFVIFEVLLIDTFKGDKLLHGCIFQVDEHFGIFIGINAVELDSEMRWMLILR